MIQKFKKIAREVEAIQFNGNSNRGDIEKFVGKEIKADLESETAYVASAGPPFFSLLFETKDGVVKVFRGDWIVKETYLNGKTEFYPCNTDVFCNTFKLVL